MDQRRCAVCSESFTPATARHIYCSKRCGRWAGLHLNRKVCSIEGCPRPHRARGFCANHYNQKYFPNRHQPHLAECAACGATFERWGGGAKASPRRPSCSYRCRYFLQYGHWPAGKDLIHLGPAPVCILIPKWGGTTVKGPRQVFIQGDCAWCGESFTAACPTGGFAARYCSESCLKRSAKSRGGRFNPSPVQRLRIYERDNWTCQLCSEPVDRDASGDWAPSLDHIECQSWTETPDHSDGNLRTAHHWCNAVRGDERYYTALDFTSGPRKAAGQHAAQGC